MSVLKTFVFFLALLRTSIRASISVRGAFLLESFLMIANNLIVLLIWWVFFKQFKEVGGWTMSDMIALNAIVMGSYGLSQICFGGVNQLSKIILNGDLDSFMTQPKNLLIHLIGSKSRSKGWGQLMTTVILIMMGKFSSIAEILLIFVSVVCASFIFTSVAIIAHSLAFWLGCIENVSKKYCDSLFVFAMYPTNIYSGVLQIVMFTVIPAGVIGFIPIELLRNFSWINFIILLSSSAVFFASAFFVFHLGLKKYESGNQFGMRL